MSNESSGITTESRVSAWPTPLISFDPGLPVLFDENGILIGEETVQLCVDRSCVEDRRNLFVLKARHQYQVIVIEEQVSPSDVRFSCSPSDHNGAILSPNKLVQP